ncbi:MULTISPECIES: efflux RND transporter periplasmic adaptor subunit [unclassified Beijerinckia]|uniref:efflux RND transporter periplasmic adaptor subunit n=1 Tax=unclassified Beijerinckia TaxID=2638183 RepID=UPI00089C1E2D|nr:MULTISPECIES: efflux RND transporter periplasmic adaptor subunit [unclassified Beijerinckia]MDH7798733.1 cobalt-zinc-cadmium efflux system membrane fusion protein [Beijerinckia sp. GAS462]SED31228.1 membrane fusion protein, cobalt-zinc-cadmium efflux system [Beijerinckia sp. 28-YEA-48]
MTRNTILAATLFAGILMGALAASKIEPVRNALTAIGLLSDAPAQAQTPQEAHGHEDKEGAIVLSDAQVEAGQFTVAPAAAGELYRRLTAPAVVTPDPDKIARVAAKVVGTVAEMRKKLGDVVRAGEIIAIIDSREVAEAKSAFLAATVTYELQTDLFQREKRLYDQKISAEQQFLRVRATTTESRLQLELARQKLAALDLTTDEVNALAKQPVEALRRKEIRAPIDGRIIERRVDVGAPVNGEGQEKELYVIADLSGVWADLSVPTADLTHVHEGDKVTAATDAGPIEGKIVFVSPILNQETRSARVIAAFDNTSAKLRPGTYLTAKIIIDAKPVELKVPKSALQTIGSEQVVFVRTKEGFAKREVALGDSDDDSSQIVFGLDPGEEIATKNTFTLKADLGKSEAEHAH